MSKRKKKINTVPEGPSVWTGRIVWAALLLVMVGAGLVRYRLVDIPLERDEGEYAYAGQLMLDGVAPYKEVYNMKLPGIYAAYAVILAIFGQTLQGVHLGLLVINEITIILVFLLAKRLMDSIAAVTAAAVFAVLSLGSAVYGLSANAEHFVMVFAVGGLLLLLWALDKKSMWALFLAGVLLGTGITMKQHGGAFGLAAMVFILLDGVFQKPFSWQKWLKMELVFAAGLIMVAVVLCLTMLWVGVFKEFWFWTVDYARSYVSQVPLQQGLQLLVSGGKAVILFSPLIWMMTGLGLVCLTFPWTTSIQKNFLSTLAVFSFLSICPGFYFRPHYFILLLPCAALLAGVTVSVLTERLLPRMSIFRLVGLVLAVICIAQSIYLHRNYFFRWEPNAISRWLYGMNPFVESSDIGTYLRSRTLPEDTIAVVGSEPQIFFYTHRRSASGHIYMYPLMENNKLALQMQDDFIRETEEEKPKFVVFVHVHFSWLQNARSCTQIFQWFQSYCQTQYNLVGTVEMYDYTTAYHLEPQVKWPTSSPDWLAVYERKTDPNQ